jgi:hypothetical protein
MGEDGVGGQFRGVSYEAGVPGLRGDVLRGTDGTVVYVSVCLDSVWPSLTADMEELYQLGQHCVPVMSRKGGRMMCMGENRTPVLLRMLAGGRIQEFRECAAVFYAKMQETYVGDRRVFPMYSSEKTSNLEEKKKLATTSVSSKSRMQMANPLARLISHAKVKGMARMVSIYTSTSQHKHLYSCICRIYLS